jgi:uncharacterized protein (TIGR02453 family)
MLRPMAAFKGFDKDAIAFLHELTIEMNKDWFEANKPRYQRVWVEPLTALLEHVQAKLAKIYAPVKLVPHVFRIYRDVRFSKDKTPYKTHVAGVLRTGVGSAMYLHVETDEEWVGAGTYFFEDTQLPKWRKLVAADRTGKDIQGIVGKLRKKGYEVGGHEDYKRVPKPFTDDHPRAEFLRMKGLTAAFPAMPKGMLHRADLADWLVEHGRAVAPMVSWLRRV